ncbi:MAG: hypothetical protein WAW21_13865 [Corynebacterium variabile]
MAFVLVPLRGVEPVQDYFLKTGHRYSKVGVVGTRVVEEVSGMVDERAPFGRPRGAPLPEQGRVRLQVGVPVGVARGLYAQAAAERRHLADIVTQALKEYAAAHPPESWSPKD